LTLPPICSVGSIYLDRPSPLVARKFGRASK